MCFECLCLSCNRLMLRRTEDPKVAEEQRSKGSVKQLEQRNAKQLEQRYWGTYGTEKELRKNGTAERAGPDKLKDLVGPSRARTKQMDQDMRSMDMRTCKCVKIEMFKELSWEKTAMTAGEAARVSRGDTSREDMDQTMGRVGTWAKKKR